MFFDNLVVQHYTGPLVEENVYYPFGLTMAGISSKAAGKAENKKKYQGYESNTVFDLNIYEAFYRTHDPQIGRWWQIDPKPESGLAISHYAAMNNNPISGIDLLGDVVEYERGEGVTKKEFRQFKREIRQMRRHSESFRKMYNDFKKDKQTFKYIASNSTSGGATTKTEKGYDMSISIHGKDPNQGGNEKFSTVSQVAHETGHGFRRKYNLESAPPGRMPSTFGMSSDKATDALNNHTTEVVNYNNKKELGASHIENIVLSELINSGSNSFNGIALSQTYFGGAGKQMVMSNGRALYVPVETNLDKLAPPHTKDYYMNTKFDIYAEHGIQHE